MKRVFISLFISVLMLVGCGESEENASKEETNEGNDVQAESEPEYDLDDAKKLGITMDDVINVENVQKEIEEYSKVKTYETDDGLTVDVINRDSTLSLYTYKFEGEDYPSVVIAKTNAVPIVNEDAVKILSDIMVSLDEDVYPFAEVVPGMEEDNYLTVGIVFNNEHDIKDLPVFISDIATDDYFSNSDNVEFFNESSSHAEYKELYEHANSYIEKNDVKGHDSAHEIIEILEPVYELMDKVEIQYDDFENVSTIYYEGLTDVGDSNHIVPFIMTSDNEMSLLVGFERDGWLFSNNLYFNIDGERESFGSYDPDRDTLGGSRIREEYIKTNYDEELIESIINANEVKMRFEGDKGELDYTLTDTDKKAIETIQSFNNIKNNLSNLLYRFENN